MAYNPEMRNPAMMNPMDKDMKYGHMSHEEKKKELLEELDNICTYLYCGVHWNVKAANACRKIMIRGFGRWHDCEAKSNFCSLEKLEKIMQDKLGHMPMVDMEMVSNAEKYTMNNMEDFKNHFKMWEDNKDELIECLNDAIHCSRTIDLQIYKELMCLADEAQSERMRTKMAHGNLAMGGFNPHDVSIKSMIIHKYFETEHKDGGEININLG